MSEKTCGNCDKVRVTDVMGMYIFGCSETGFVIPHEAIKETEKVTFWRIPPCCPRTDNEVFKSEKQAPRKEWIIKKFSDFTPTK